MAGNILIVDDDRLTRVMLSTILEGGGHGVTAAADGEEALRLAGKTHFDLVLLDIWMPGMGGLEALDKLRALEPPPRVIVLTSDETPETLLAAVRGQASRYLTKPIEAEGLLEVVAEELETPERPHIELLSGRPDWVELEVPCRLEVVDQIQNILGQLAANLNEEVRRSVGQAFRELLSNAIEWGGALDPERKVRISYLHMRRLILYRISDPGSGFRFEDLSHAAVGYPADQPLAHVGPREAKGLRPGGFGVLLARALVDELIYNEAQNEVVFVKYLD
ncbi:MAG TPA: response regulator [Candidatus Acidoferrales bacterium]|nr:response regulator [Candidatus Acidoferrales bacterium]